MSDLNKDLVSAVENGHLEEVKRLVKEGASVNTEGKSTWVLHMAAFRGHKEIVAHLIKSGANPNQQSEQNYYALHFAASKGEEAICNILIKAGADISAKTDKEGTPLHVAAASNQARIVNLLVKAGADIEAKDYVGNTALNTAAALGAKAAVSALIKGGADLNTKNEESNTPLLNAAFFLYNYRIPQWSSEGTVEGTAVKYRITKGAFRYINPLVATEKKWGKILSVKEQQFCVNQSWGPKEHQPYLDAMELIKKLLKAGADVHQKNIMSQTVMSLICHSGEARLIQEVFKAGGRFNTKEDFNITPLQRVAGSGRLDGLQMFFKLATESDYEINGQDEFGWTAAHYLADIGGYEEMAKLLLKKGADITIGSTQTRGEGTPKGITAAGVAKLWKDEEMAELLS